MPRDTEADRIVRERRAQQQARAAKEQADAARQAEAQREMDLRTIDDEISRILPLLAKLGYPDMEEVEFVEVEGRKSLFGGQINPHDRPRSIKAAWVIGTHLYSFPGGDSMTGKLFLLSDGYIGFGGTKVAWSPALLREFTRTPESIANLPDIVSGLRALRQKLEAM